MGKENYYLKNYCCYFNTVENFLAENKSEWMSLMKSSFKENFPDLSLDNSQVQAWSNCFAVLQNDLKPISQKFPGFYIIFEYILPYEAGRRPDVILLSKEHVLVLEFKQYSEVFDAHLDQVYSYARDLAEYHYESRDKEVTPVLICTKSNFDAYLKDNVYTCGKGHLSDVINQVITKHNITPLNKDDCIKWMKSKYEPLPTIIEAAEKVFHQESLPNIRRVNSTNIPRTLKLLKDIAQDAAANNKHVLAFVTGVPGAGKTYLGLQYVYETSTTQNLCDPKAISLYITGNGPLVTVLQDALKSRVFVQDMYAIDSEYQKGKITSFDKNIIVFDEGQRAWDLDRMKGKRSINKSEPDILVDLCDHKLDWSVLLILVGEGQEIYKGENSGLGQWNTALKNASSSWEIICPDKLKNIFSGNVKTSPDLDLDISLRTHTASDASKFVNLLLDGQLDKAKQLTPSLIDNGFFMHYTRDLQKAKEYCIERYKNNENKRYGCLVSSKARESGPLGPYHFYQEYYHKPKIAKWFNAPVSDPESCCGLETAVTEFDCQGLEIDMPIIGWNDDLFWDKTQNTWKVKSNRKIIDSGDEFTQRINSYRVLLTRGRDGFIVFIPNSNKPDTQEKMNTIAEIFDYLGVPLLK